MPYVRRRVVAMTRWSILKRRSGVCPLPRYYFQVAGGNHVLDVEGRDLSDPAAARLDGIRFAGEILHGMPTLLYETAFIKIDVTDESGKVLFKVLVTTLADDERISIPG